MPDNPHRVPVRYDPKGKAFGAPGTPGAPLTFDQIIDEVRDEVFYTIFDPGKGSGSAEQNYFNGAKRCDLVNIMEVSALIETARQLDQTLEGPGGLPSPHDSNVAWSRVRVKFQDAVNRECDCKKIWL